MEDLHPPKGLIVDLITPLTKGCEIDGEGLERHLKRVMPHVHAVWLGSPFVGEGEHLTPELREGLLDRAMSLIGGRIPIFVWVTQGSEDGVRETVLRLHNRIEARRYSGRIFWVDAPLFYHSNRGLPELYQEMTTRVQEPFILHNDPKLIQRMGSPFKRNNIRTSILKDIVRIDQVQGLIFSGSLDRAHHYQKAVRSRLDFHMYDGDESRFLIHPSLSGVVSVGANLAPEAWYKITLSSLRMNNRKTDYPDYLKQIWEIGGYLSHLRDIYQGHGARIIKMILADKGVLNDASCMEGEGDLDEDRRKELEVLVQQYNDSH
jgi:dihydrodipicolinate synthase/N-acetylneuraminate lyase